MGGTVFGSNGAAFVVRDYEDVHLRGFRCPDCGGRHFGASPGDTRSCHDEFGIGCHWNGPIKDALDPTEDLSVHPIFRRQRSSMPNLWDGNDPTSHPALRRLTPTGDEQARVFRTFITTLDARLLDAMTTPVHGIPEIYEVWSRWGLLPRLADDLAGLSEILTQAASDTSPLPAKEGETDPVSLIRHAEDHLLRFLPRLHPTLLRRFGTRTRWK